MSTNPFFESWTTPCGIPPFNRIRPEHFPPALERGMAEHLADIAAITGDNDAPSFENTIEALERAGQLLNRVRAVFANLVVSNGTDALQAIDLDFAPLLAAHHTQIALDSALFARIDALFDGRGALDLRPDARRLLERTHLGFVRAGASLAGPAKTRMGEINQRLAILHTNFGQNVLHDEKSFHLVLGPDDVAGLPEFLLAAAQQAALERGVEGRIITLSRSLADPFMTYSTRRDLRQAVHAAWTSRGAHAGARDNRVLIPEILALRHERAQLLGYENFAAFRLADSMAGTPEAVARLTTEVWNAATSRVAAEEAKLLEIARTDGIETIMPWDWQHYAERVRTRDHAIDDAAIKPYFPLDAMQQAAFDTASRLFGLTFVPRPDMPTYHPDVRSFEVFADGSPKGVYLADHFARQEKRSGAWMSSYRDQQTLDTPVTPIIVNNNNVARATPTLLSFDDASTLFHEFGHALHGLLSQVHYPSQAGTAVRRDFVEFPSQIYEHWLETPEILREYARHHETGAPIPEDLLEKLLAARNFNQGFATTEYTASAILDMALHTHPDPGSLDIDSFEREVMAGIGMPKAILPRHRPAHFQHLFAGGGYAAGYYAYLWAEVLDADGYEAFVEAGSPFDPATSARLKQVLSAGDSQDPMALYIGFRGRAPDTLPLLRNRGLT
jgi:peptidyl-dipeptidase Dcp